MAAVCVDRGRWSGAGEDRKLIGETDGFRGDPDWLLSVDWSRGVECSEAGLLSGMEAGGGTKRGREGTGGRGGFSSSSGGGGGGGASDGRGGAVSDGSGSGTVGGGSCFSSATAFFSSFLTSPTFSGASGPPATGSAAGGGLPPSVASTAVFLPAFSSPILLRATPPADFFDLAFPPFTVLCSTADSRLSAVRLWCEGERGGE